MKMHITLRFWHTALFASVVGIWFTAAHGQQDEGPAYEDYEVQEETEAEDAFADDFAEDDDADADAYTPTPETEPQADNSGLEFLAPNLGLSQPEAKSPVPQDDNNGLPRVAVLRGLEKVTARVREFEVPVGDTVQFGRLEITVRYCRSRPPEEMPETSAYLDVDDHLLDGSTKRIFSGWMFASTPALNPVQHPVYDVWVINCKTRAPEASESSL